jgi:hypothetical protein
VNRGYEDLTNRIITHVDGVKPQNLADLARLVETGVGEFVRFTDFEGRQIVLSRAEAVAEGPRIASTYQLPADRSEELKPRDYLKGLRGELPAQRASRRDLLSRRERRSRASSRQ